MQNNKKRAKMSCSPQHTRARLAYVDRVKYSHARKAPRWTLSRWTPSGLPLVWPQQNIASNPVFSTDVHMPPLPTLRRHVPRLPTPPFPRRRKLSERPLAHAGELGARRHMLSAPRARPLAHAPQLGGRRHVLSEPAARPLAHAEELGGLFVFALSGAFLVALAVLAACFYRRRQGAKLG